MVSTKMSKSRAMGQLFFMGWEGTAVTPQIRSLIVDHHLGAILLTTKNLKSKGTLYFSFVDHLPCPFTVALAM